LSPARLAGGCHDLLPASCERQSPGATCISRMAVSRPFARLYRQRDINRAGHAVWIEELDLLRVFVAISTVQVSRTGHRPVK
jgi:hypothetical protein